MFSKKRLIRGFYMLCVLGSPGCVLFPEVIDSSIAIARPIESLEQNQSQVKETQNTPTSSYKAISLPLSNDQNSDLPGKIPAFEGLPNLNVDDLIKEVLKRNPTLTAMTAASEAAWAKYPQAISLEDPNLGGWLAPATIGSNQVNVSMRVEYSQKLPGLGKRQLRGDIAQAQASATEKDIEVVKLQLVEDARLAFYDFHLVDQAMEVNSDTLKLIEEFRQNAETRYKNGQAPQQDVLQAEVEIGLQKERSIALKRMKKVAQARINTLLHLEPDLALPTPMKDMFLRMDKRNSEEMRNEARENRPDLKSLEDQIRADNSAVALARKDFNPDYEAMAAYDSFWQGMDKQMQYQIGLRMNLPSQRSKRFAALSEAQAKLAQHKADYQKLSDQINFQVQEAYEQLLESNQILDLINKTTLPAVRNNIKEAQSSYITGKIPFLTLVTAQKELTLTRDRYYQIQTESFRRQAALDRATGRLSVPEINIKLKG